VCQAETATQFLCLFSSLAKAAKCIRSSLAGAEQDGAALPTPAGWHSWGGTATRHCTKVLTLLLLSVPVWRQCRVSVM